MSFAHSFAMLVCKQLSKYKVYNCEMSVRAYAGKTRQIVYKHQQVEMMKCRNDISQKNLFFKNIIYLVVN